MLHHSAHIGGGMCIVAHGWAHGAPRCAKERGDMLCSSQYVFFMSQGEAGGQFQVSGFRGAGSLVSGFWFQVPRYFVPLR